MDPITRASKVFLKEAAAHWKAQRSHVLFLEADASSRGDLVKTLRLAEQAPSCRRPLFLFEGAFVEPEGYFAALSTSMARDYGELRQGAAEEGVLLPVLGDRPSLDEGSSPCALVGFRTREIERALEGKLEGIDLALIPRQVATPLAFREAVAALAGELGRSGARLLVLATPGGPLSDMAKGNIAHFHVDPDELADYLMNLGNTESDGPAAPPPGATAPETPDMDAAGGASGAGAARVPDARGPRELRGLLLAAARASREGDHAGAVRLFEQARGLCTAGGWTIDEAAVVLAVAGACLAAGSPERAAASYEEAFALATRAEALPLAAQAALGQGAVRMQQKRYADAMGAYAAAAEMGERAGAPMLHVEARRMEGTAALAAGKHTEALRAWKAAVEAGSRMDAAARKATTWEEVVGALVTLLRTGGMTAQAEHVEAQAAAIQEARSPAVHAQPRAPMSSPDAPPPAGADPGLEGPGKDAGAHRETPAWMTGPVDLSRLNLPALPFDGAKKP